MKYIPHNNRVIVKVTNTEFEKNAAGIIVATEKTSSKNNLIRATIVACGERCEFFNTKHKGLEVLIHEIAGVPMEGIDNQYRILREDDIWAWTEEAPVEGINIADVHKESELSKLIERGDSM